MHVFCSVYEQVDDIDFTCICMYCTFDCVSNLSVSKISPEPLEKFTIDYLLEITWGKMAPIIKQRTLKNVYNLCKFTDIMLKCSVVVAECDS